ncbi:MAG: acyl-CoA reductase [Ilyomonas sp.]
MNTQERIDLLVRLGEYIHANDEQWQMIKERAYRENPWFIPEFIERAVENVSSGFLDRNKLENWISNYAIKNSIETPKTIGVVMAGNIPLVGFHDFLCVFISGNKALIKLSSKDEVLIKHLVQKLIEWKKEVETVVAFADVLKGCDAYIATGSNNSGRYFDYYFGKYPNIIRKNRTSVAILNGDETMEQLDLLSNDIQLYFGLGCRNVTKLYVPANYDFLRLLDALKKYEYLISFHKYKHNYDYQLALLIMNNKKYLNNGSIILTENESLFSPVSQLNYEYYEDKNKVIEFLQQNNEVQCIVGENFVPFGEAQQPSLNDYADGTDTLKFITELPFRS